MPNKILIISAKNNFASKITNKLSENDYSIAILDIFSDDFKNIDLENAFEKEKPDCVIYIPCQNSFETSIFNPSSDIEKNILPLVKILENCKKFNVEKIILFSNASIYGDLKNSEIDESFKNPTNPYGLANSLIEEYVQATGIPYVILRLSNVYGLEFQPLNENGVVEIFAKKMKENSSIDIFSNGEQKRDFIYIDDVLYLLVQTLKKDIKNEIINLSTNKSISINELFEKMSKIYGYKKSPNYLPKRLGEITNSVLSNKKALKIFDDFKFSDLSDGLVKMKEDICG